MNFKDLAERLRTLEGDDNATAMAAQTPTAPPSTSYDMEECGDNMPIMPAVMHTSQGQQDSVSMNVSMNGSGPGGIKSLMDILRNIESASSDADAEIIVTEPHAGHGQHDQGPEVELGEKQEQLVGHDVDHDKGSDVKNRPHRVTYNVDTITQHGDDIHSKGDVKRLKPAGGENPLQEGLIERLTNLYDQVKSRTLKEGCNEDPHRHALANIIASHKHDVNQFEQSGRLSPELYEKLYDYFFDGMGYREKKHDDHEVRHAHVAHNFKHAMMTPECQTALSQYAPVSSAPAPAMASIAEDHDLELEDIAEASEKKTMSRAAKGIMKYGKKGMQALRDAEAEGKDLEPVRAKYNKYDEAYNPNSAGAEHARGIKASHKAELEKKAKAGDESAKKQLKAMNDRDEQMRNDYNARMER